MSSKEVEPALEPTWRSDKAHEAICEAAERIANHYCSEDDTYHAEVRRLTVAISDVVDTRVPLASTAPGVDDLKLVIEGVIRQHHTARTHQPTYCCPEDEPVYDRLLVRMLMEKLAAASPAPKEEEAHRCPHCGRRMIGDFDEDVGFWYECANCDYREAVSSTVTAAKPSGAAREAAEEIREWLGITGLVDGEGINEVAAIISRHFPTAVESRCVHNVPVGYGCHYCPDTIATTPPAPLVSDCDPDG